VARKMGAATAAPEIELMPMPVQLGSAIGGGAAAAATAGGASFPANPRDFTAVAPNKRAAASSAGNLPLPDLSPLGEDDDRAEEDDDEDDDGDVDVAQRAATFMTRLQTIMFDLSDVADDEDADGDDGTGGDLPCPFDYIGSAWENLTLNKKLDFFITTGRDPAAAGFGDRVGRRPGGGAVGGASIPMPKSSSSRPSKRVTAADSAAAASESNRSAPKARASYKQSYADREFISIIAAAMKVDLGGTTTWEDSIGRRILKRCQTELISMTSSKSPLSKGPSFDAFIDRLFGFSMQKFQRQQMEMATVRTVLLMFFTAPLHGVKLSVTLIPFGWISLRSLFPSSYQRSQYFTHRSPQHHVHRAFLLSASWWLFASP